MSPGYRYLQKRSINQTPDLENRIVPLVVAVGVPSALGVWETLAAAAIGAHVHHPRLNNMRIIFTVLLLQVVYKSESEPFIFA